MFKNQNWMCLLRLKFYRAGFHICVFCCCFSTYDNTYVKRIIILYSEEQRQGDITKYNLSVCSYKYKSSNRSRVSVFVAVRCDLFMFLFTSSNVHKSFLN